MKKRASSTDGALLLAVGQLGQTSGNPLEEIKPLAASSQNSSPCHLVPHAQDELLFNSFYAGRTNVSLPPLISNAYDDRARFQHRLRMIVMEPLNDTGNFRAGCLCWFG